MDGLAKNLGDVEYQGCMESGVVVSQDQTKRGVADNKKSPDTSRRSQLTLLGIPQELRDKIFSYAYDEDTSDVDITRGVVELLQVSSPDGEDIAFTPDQCLPPRDPLLICRQLHTEMRPARVKAYRNYWTKNLFMVEAFTESRFRWDEDQLLWYRSTEPYENDHPYPAEHELVADENLKHVHCFAFFMNPRRERYVLLFTFDKAWRVRFMVPEDPERSDMYRDDVLPEGRRSENLKRTLTELNARVGNEAIRNPSAGRGFNAFRLREFTKLLQYRFAGE